MDNLSYTYALVKSLHDQACDDYIDCFYPFVISVLKADCFKDPKFIKNSINNNFDLEIPLHVLSVLVTRAKKRGYIEQAENKRIFKLTDKGLKYINKLETTKSVERRINALNNDMALYFQDHGFNLTQQEISDIIVSFLQRNKDPVLELLNPHAIEINMLLRTREKHDSLIVEYIVEAEKNKPDHYKTFEDMILGSIIALVINASDPSEIEQLSSKKFKNCHAFLDSNYIFSLLELDPPEYNEPAIELYNLMKEYGIELRVFSFTIDEICRFINGYIHAEGQYSSIVNVDTLYSSLKRKGWTKTTAREFIMDIENIISNKNITIEYIKNVDLHTYIPLNDTHRKLLSKYKPKQSNVFYQNHDIAALEKIMELREQKVRRIEDAEVIFVTSDNQLSRLNFMEMGHKENGTICEIILDKVLANLLWLKNPKGNIPLKSIIAAYSEGLFIKKRVWERFYEVLKSMKQDDVIKDDNISTLFYHGYIEQILIDIAEMEVDIITPEFVLEQIEDATRFKEEELHRQIADVEARKSLELKEFIAGLEEQESVKQKEREDEWIAKQESFKKNIWETSEKLAAKRVKYLKITAVVLLVLPMIGLLAAKKWIYFGGYTGSITTISFIIQFILHDYNAWDKLKYKWLIKICAARKREIGLEDI